MTRDIYNAATVKRIPMFLSRGIFRNGPAALAGRALAKQLRRTSANMPQNDEEDRDEGLIAYDTDNRQVLADNATKDMAMETGRAVQ